jgi:phosphonate transport system substrate-binding protein
VTPIRSLALLVITTLAMLTALALGGCSKPAEDPGAAAVPAPSSAPAQTSDDDKPITMYFVPSMEAGEVITSAEEIVAALEERTGYTFDVEVPTSYIAVVEAMGAEPARADIAWLSTFAYVLASDKYGAEIALQVGRYGELEYRGMFVTRKDSGIKSLEDIAGKTIAFVDPASTSGHIYPSAMLKDRGIEPAETVFAGGHPQAMLAVYSGRTDVGCAYYSPTSDEGEIRDARKDLLKEYPDAGEVLQIIEFTDWIPNDTVTFRRGFPAEKKDRIVQALLDYLATPEGAKALGELYNITELVPVEDAGYDSVREKLAALGIADESTLQALIERNELPSDEAAGESATESAAEPVEEEPGA